MDENNDKLLQINFDIVMHDLPCKFLQIAVFDSFGDERVDPRSEVFHYIPVDTDGFFTGHAYDSSDVKQKVGEVNPDDLAPIIMTPEEERELDSDWSSTDDHFKHKSFKDAIQHHEFSLVLFYADWCSHCRQFHPMWNDMVKEISMKENFKNNRGHDMQVKLMKINCVDFAQVCQDEKIYAFPLIKLYSDDFQKPGVDASPVPFMGKRSVDNFRNFLIDNVGKSSKDRAQHVKEESARLHEGCQVRGYLTVPRVPGEFHLEASADQIGGQLNPTMTNVSHTVRHLSFGNVASSYRQYELTRDFAEFPSYLLNNMMPLDGKSFSTKEHHQAPQHYLKVISTSLDFVGSQIAYQMTHSDRISTVDSKGPEKGIPQAKFMYDLSPMSVKLKLKQKRWYEFVTSLCAIVGGFYTVAKLTSRTILSVVGKKEN